MRVKKAAAGRACGDLCTALLWALRLAFLSLLVLFGQSLFPPRAQWAGLLAAALVLAAAAQLPLACIRAAFQRPARNEPPAKQGDGARLVGSLEWKDVTCRPPGEDRPALRRVSFRLAEGATMVLGGGDLFGRLSTGALNVDEGTVYYGATPIERIAPEELGRKVVLLTGCDAPQAGTISALLRAGDERGRDLARELGLHPLIRAAGGYQSPPGRLSEGGLILARVAAALAGKPRLLILDHLLERLDEDAADRVLEAAARRGVDCAAVTVREGLSARFGHVLEFQGDTLLFQGTRDEFLTWEEARHGRAVK